MYLHCILWNILRTFHYGTLKTQMKSAADQKASKHDTSKLMTCASNAIPTAGLKDWEMLA